MKDERKEREPLLEDFKKLGFKNKRLKDEMKVRKGNPSKRIKLTKNTQRELEKAQKQTKELRGKIAGERQVWEDKYKMDMEKQS